MTVLSEMRGHLRLGAGSLAPRDRVGDGFVQRDMFVTFLVVDAGLPADVPGLARDDVERADDEREQRIARGGGDFLVEVDVKLHHAAGSLPKSARIEAASAISSRRLARRFAGSAASPTVRISIVRLTSRICCTVI